MGDSTTLVMMLLTRQSGRVTAAAKELPSGRDVHEALARQWASGVERLGLHRVQKVNYPAWCSNGDSSGEKVFISAQVDAKATDLYSGGGFRVELEKSCNPTPASGLNGRALFFQLLTTPELKGLLDRQNTVIQALPRPPAAQVEVYPAGPVRDQYLAYFDPQTGFDSVRSWLRFLTIGDVMMWAEALQPLLGTLIGRAEQLLRPDERFLGEGSLV